MLEVKNLKIEFYDHSRPEVAVRDVDFSMKEGEIIGLVGESGSGKSLTATAIAGLIRRGDVKISGEVLWDKDVKKSGETSQEKDVKESDESLQEKNETIDLLKAPRRVMRSLQGNEIGFIFQNPMTAFSPVHKIGYQVEDALRVHGKLRLGEADSEALNGKQSSGRKIAYSKEELKQLALKALAAVDLPDPERVYNSYPFELSGGMRQRAMIASAMISSPRLLIADEPTTALDVTVQAEIIKLLQRINEQDHTAILFISHDLGLVKKLCSKVIVLKDGDVVESGDAAEIFSNPKGDYTKKLIAANIELGDIAGAKEKKSDFLQKEKTTESVCEVKDFSYFYPVSSWSRLFSSKDNKNAPGQQEKIGIHDITMTIHKGEIVGLVGESGSGKSTLAKCIVGLLHSDDGSIKCGRTGMIFQDSYSALNPKKRIGWLLKEALRLSGVKEQEAIRDRILEIMKEVELPEEFLERFPAELSGGQRQRVMIAMALLQEPTLLVADEPVSALDVAIQESITKLLKRLSEERNMAILFISHDLRTVYNLCDKVCVMQKGRIVEEAPKEELYLNPKEEYTKLLLRSALE